MKTAQLIAGGLIAGTVALGTMGIVESAQATTFKFHRNGAGGGALGPNFESVETTYNDATEELTWSSTFSSTAIDGAWLVLNDGPNPKQNEDEELAIFYLDGLTNRLTAYEYNGKNDSNSWFDQDFIQSWDNAVNVVDNGGERTLSFSIDATDVNEYGVLQDPLWQDWKGAQFDEKIGIWFHAVQGLDTAYNGDELTQFDFTSQGWYDIGNQMTKPVPEPGTLGALAVGLLGLLRLSQRKKA